MCEPTSITGTREQKYFEDGVDPRHVRLLVCTKDIEEAHHLEEFRVQLWYWNSDQKDHQ